MAEYSLFAVTPQLAPNADSAVTVGCEFRVDTSCWLVGVRYLHPTGGSTAARTMGVYDLSQNLVAGPYTMPAGTNGAWCALTLPTPVVLAPGNYRVACLFPAGDYPYQSGYFSSINDTAHGPITELSAFSVAGQVQGSYTYGASLSYPTSTASGGNFWPDVIVSDTDPDGGGGEAFTGSIGLSGTGTLSATGSALLVTEGLADFSGTGTLSASGSASQGSAGAADLSGAGTLAAAGIALLSSTGAVGLSGTGTLSAVGVADLSITGAVLLSGAGTLAVVGAKKEIIRAKATISRGGPGFLSFLRVVNFDGAVVLSGAGQLAMTGSNIAHKDVQVTARLGDPKPRSASLPNTRRWSATLP